MGVVCGAPVVIANTSERATRAQTSFHSNSLENIPEYLGAVNDDNKFAPTGGAAASSLLKSCKKNESVTYMRHIEGRRNIPKPGAAPSTRGTTADA